MHFLPLLLLDLPSTFSLLSLQWQEGWIPLCEWGAVICSELYVGTFFFDLGDEYFIEQVKVPSHKHYIDEEDDLYCVE